MAMTPADYKVRKAIYNQYMETNFPEDCPESCKRLFNVADKFTRKECPTGHVCAKAVEEDGHLLQDMVWIGDRFAEMSVKECPVVTERLEGR